MTVPKRCTIFLDRIGYRIDADAFRAAYCGIRTFDLRLRSQFHVLVLDHLVVMIFEAPLPRGSRSRSITVSLVELHVPSGFTLPRITFLVSGEVRL